MPSNCNQHRPAIMGAKSFVLVVTLMAAQLTAAQFAYGQPHQRGAWAVSQGGNPDETGSPEQPHEQRPPAGRRQFEEGGPGDGGAFPGNQDGPRRRHRRNFDGQGGPGDGQFGPGSDGMRRRAPGRNFDGQGGPGDEGGFGPGPEGMRRRGPGRNFDGPGGPGDEGGFGPGPDGTRRFGQRRNFGMQGGPGDGGAFPGQNGMRRPGPGGNFDGQGPGQFGKRFGQGEPGGMPGGKRFGQGGGGGFASRRFGSAIDLQKLGLSEEQKQKIRATRSKNSGRARELRESLKTKRTEMKDLMFDPNATDGQIRAKRRELRNMQDQMEEMQIDDFLSMRSMLTPEQRKRLPEIMPQPGRQAGLPPGPQGPGPQAQGN